MPIICRLYQSDHNLHEHELLALHQVRSFKQKTKNGGLSKRQICRYCCCRVCVRLKVISSDHLIKRFNDKRNGLFILLITILCNAK